MTMHLLPAYYTTSVSRKKKNTPKSKATIAHEAWLAKKGLSSTTTVKKSVDKKWVSEYNNTLRTNRRDYVSAGMSGSSDACAKRDIMSNLHKETAEVRSAILDKASRIMPLFNKGGLQYATPDTDLTTVGSKSRRG